MRARLHDLAFLHDNNPVGLLDSREAMSDGDGGTVFGDAVKGRLYFLFAADVDGAGRLIED